MIWLKIKSLLYKAFVIPAQWYWALPRKRKWVVASLSFLGAFVLGVVSLFLFYFAVASGLFGKIPSDDDLQNLKHYQASEVYSSDGVLLGRYFVENRSDATYDQIPQTLINALIATEDSRFYKHKGVDTRSLMRVLFKSVILRQGKGGGSTLSQQLAKNLYGRKNYGWLTMPVNKVREAIIANKLETLYSKKEILMLYLNTVSFGEDTYGIKTASQRFFAVEPKGLSTDQLAILVGMLKAPSLYNPRTRPAKSIERRNVVLTQMQNNGYLTDAELVKFQKKPIVLKYRRIDNQNGSAPYFREKIRIELEEWLKEHPKADGTTYNLYTDGLKIKTTVHSKLQKYAEMASLEHLRTMQVHLNRDLRANAFYRKNYGIIAQEIKNSKRYKALKERNYLHKDIISEMQKKDSIDMYSHWGESTRYMSPIDSIYENLITLKVGFMAVDPRNGDVLAWVGGPDYKKFQYDHVTARRQVGSVFKPVVYARAMVDGKKPCDFITNQKVTYTQYDDWTPENSNDNYEGKYSLAGALTHSVNTISVKLCMESGIHNVTSMAHKLGIDSELPEQPSLALGTADISLYEMLRVYSVFASEGKRPEFNLVKKITDQKGNVIFNYQSKVEEVLSPELCQQMTNMLKSVVENGTANDLHEKYKLSGEIAGKTGTTQDHRDAWFIGYTPNLLAGVWVGADNPAVHFTAMELGQGSMLAMPIWAKFYQKASYGFSGVYTGLKFPFENDIDCELYTDGNLFDRIFKRREVSNEDTGLEKEAEDSVKAKKKKKWFRIFRKNKGD